MNVTLWVKQRSSAILWEFFECSFTTDVLKSSSSLVLVSHQNTVSFKNLTITLLGGNLIGTIEETSSGWPKRRRGGGRSIEVAA